MKTGNRTQRRKDEETTTPVFLCVLRVFAPLRFCVSIICPLPLPLQGTPLGGPRPTLRAGLLMRSLWRFLTSVKTTIGLFVILCTLLLISVAVPTEKYLGPGAEEFAGSGPGRFFIETMGLGSVSTSPLFLGCLTLFFLNLSAVIFSRTAVTLRRTRLRPPSETTLRAWCDGKSSQGGVSARGLTTDGVLRILHGMGFPAVTAGDGVAWAVKHRTAPLGFLLFHFSFYLLCLGGTLIFTTRFVGVSALVEGQAFQGFNQILRSAPMLGPPDLSLALESVGAQFEQGQALHLGAVFQMAENGVAVKKTSRINHPARSGPSTILVNRAGIAPILWLQDRQGFTLDRVAVAAETLGADRTVVDLGQGTYPVVVKPVVDRSHFPDRSELQATPIEIEARNASGSVIFAGTVRVGHHISLGDAVLVIPELRYWVGIYVVREYGGALLILGFALGTIGLIWRLMLYRREVAVVWDGSAFSVAGRAEYFSHRFREELAAIRDLLEEA